MAANQLYAGNDATLTASAMKNDAAGTFLNAATVTCQPYLVVAGEDDTAVGSPVTLSYVAASSGNYTGTLESSVIDAGFDIGDEYRLDFAASQAGVNAAWSLSGVVGRRGRS